MEDLEGVTIHIKAISKYTNGVLGERETESLQEAQDIVIAFLVKHGINCTIEIELSIT